MVAVQEVTDRPEDIIFTIGKVETVMEEEQKVRGKTNIIFNDEPSRTLFLTGILRKEVQAGHW